MEPAASAYYRAQSATTDPGRCGFHYVDLPSGIEALVSIVQGLVIDKDFVGLYGLAFEEQDRLGKLDSRYACDILERLIGKDDRPISQQLREPGVRFIGSCRDYALLLCSMLRHVGVPARLRFGFATYFSRKPDTYSDQVAPDRFGVPSIDIQGLWFIRGSLMRDLAALNKVEMLPWDYWGLADRTPIDALPEEELPMLDELAQVLDAPNDLMQLQSTFSRPELVVPDAIRSFSPLHGETKVVLR